MHIRKTWRPHLSKRSRSLRTSVSLSWSFVCSAAQPTALSVTAANDTFCNGQGLLQFDIPGALVKLCHPKGDSWPCHRWESLCLAQAQACTPWMEQQLWKGDCREDMLSRSPRSTSCWRWCLLILLRSTSVPVTPLSSSGMTCLNVLLTRPSCRSMAALQARLE